MPRLGVLCGENPEWRYHSSDEQSKNPAADNGSTYKVKIWQRIQSNQYNALLRQKAVSNQVYFRLASEISRYNFGHKLSPKSYQRISSKLFTTNWNSWKQNVAGKWRNFLGIEFKHYFEVPGRPNVQRLHLFPSQETTSPKYNLKNSQKQRFRRNYSPSQRTINQDGQMLWVSKHPESSVADKEEKMLIRIHRNDGVSWGVLWRGRPNQVRGQEAKGDRTLI